MNDTNFLAGCMALQLIQETADLARDTPPEVSSLVALVLDRMERGATDAAVRDTIELTRREVAAYMAFRAALLANADAATAILDALDRRAAR